MYDYDLLIIMRIAEVLMDEESPEKVRELRLKALGGLRFIEPILRMTICIATPTEIRRRLSASCLTYWQLKYERSSTLQAVRTAKPMAESIPALPYFLKGGSL